MEWISQLIEIFLHLDKHLNEMVAYFGLWSYLFLFLVIFCETGLVVTPILPGDSLLFAVGALAASANCPLHVGWLLVILSAAAIGGDTANYWIGHLVGPKIFHKEKVRFLNKEHLNRAHAFYERYGGKTIIIARFMPIIRTFAPFVAGIGSMTYWRFIAYNVVGGLAWISSIMMLGYCFGNISVVKNNFSIVIMAIIIISILPAAIEFIRQRRAAKAARQSSPAKETCETTKR